MVGKMTVIGLSDLFRHCNQIYRRIMYIYSEWVCFFYIMLFVCADCTDQSWLSARQ